MTSSADVSKKALEDIKGLLDKLNDSHVWNLINEIRDTCNVAIPVWFTPTLVKEITEEDLEIDLSDDQAKQLICLINDNDSGYEIGRNLVVNLIEHHFHEDIENDEEVDNSHSDEVDCDVDDATNEQKKETHDLITMLCPLNEKIISPEPSQLPIPTFSTPK